MFVVLVRVVVVVCVFGYLVVLCCLFVVGVLVVGVLVVRCYLYFVIVTYPLLVDTCVVCVCWCGVCCLFQ